MTKRDFFILIIKIFGLYILISTVFSTVTSVLSLVLYQGDIATIFMGLLSAGVVVLFFYLITFKANKIVDLLKLDKHFEDDRIDLNSLDAELILKLSVFILGGLLIIENASALITLAYKAFRYDIIGIEQERGDYVHLIMRFINILIGFLMISNLKAISGLFNRLNSK
ncbi:hypothetical protein OO013_17000 [Mangrovivirga sp. M17]|uniref:Uncharacterized protein n=1 Tax=Mangrovivirga halotolerans TaxID=2993936 RepID=A0ABT3RWI3_9BACT|nr:hypothetical protein [Mangrovivirga halotolerans]MCX2745582.1 hypothetical protein [Mangrovivirga halotolerans]